MLTGIMGTAVPVWALISIGKKKKRWALALMFSEAHRVTYVGGRRVYNM